ncbi:MAG: LTA synthase family protein [Erysipelotrichaceae bacterium]|nr:LTA synthase family protein [Erysipelotrichaceae bacterium]
MKYKTFLTLAASFIYYEIVFRLFNNLNILNRNIVLTLSFDIFVACILSFVFSMLSKKANKAALIIVTLLFPIYYALQLCLSNFYGFYFSFSLMGLSDQVKDFSLDALKVVFANGIPILLLFVPLLFVIFLYDRIGYEKIRLKESLIYTIVLLISVCAYLLALFFPLDSNGTFSRTYGSKNISLRINDLGVMNTLCLDLFNWINGSSSAIIEEPVIETEPEPDQKEFGYNVLDIDFDSASEGANDKVVEMNSYFARQNGTRQNEYTGLFEGKNLIYIMAESFNEIAVNKDLTPTLYKMIHNGFEFEDFYSATILSTIGGEFMELTGLYADYDILSIWRSGKNGYPMGLANMFRKSGYATFAYHDSQYTFQDRDAYLASIGFDNYLGCGNGLEEKMPCMMSQWPPYDTDMIDGTIDDYIDSNRFMVFYATVSGHGDYGFDTSDTSLNHHVSKVYEDLVREYYQGQLSDHIIAYVAGQIELDRAMEKLLDHLEKANKLDDTVIVLCGDHYPYYLSFNEMSKLAGYERDYQIECNSSNLIIYNSAMEKVKVDKPCGTMDILPTVYNLFGIKYDSRFIMGSDILSDSDGLVILNNNSWVSSYGKYYANDGKYVASRQLENMSEEDYVASINNVVNNKILLSYYILNNDYYDYIWKYRK